MPEPITKDHDDFSVWAPNKRPEAKINTSVFNPRLVLILSQQMKRNWQIYQFLTTNMDILQSTTGGSLSKFKIKCCCVRRNFSIRLPSSWQLKEICCQQVQSLIDCKVQPCVTNIVDTLAWTTGTLAFVNRTFLTKFSTGFSQFAVFKTLPKDTQIRGTDLYASTQKQLDSLFLQFPLQKSDDKDLKWLKLQFTSTCFGCF